MATDERRGVGADADLRGGADAEPCWRVVATTPPLRRAARDDVDDDSMRESWRKIQARVETKEREREREKATRSCRCRSFFSLSSLSSLLTITTVFLASSAPLETHLLSSDQRTLFVERPSSPLLSTPHHASTRRPQRCPLGCRPCGGTRCRCRCFDVVRKRKQCISLWGRFCAPCWIWHRYGLWRVRGRVLVVIWTGYKAERLRDRARK